MKKAALLAGLFAILVSTNIFSMEVPQHITFADKAGENYEFIPIDEYSRDKFADDTSVMFQDERVYQYYERGTPKSKGDCQGIYDRVCARCSEVKAGKQLGWEIIVDKNQKYIGFIGAAITKEDKIEFCVAIKPEMQRQNIAHQGLIAYFKAHWQRLDAEVRKKITHIKAPINPRNVASRQLAECMFVDCVDDTTYIPSYYAQLSKEKAERITIEIPIKDALEKLEELSQK